MAGRRKLSWRSLAAYPRALSPNLTSLLDSLEELVPIPVSKDRADSVLRWLDAGVEAGLIDAQERTKLFAELKPLLHARPHRRFLHAFLEGNDAKLFAYYANFEEADWARVSSTSSVTLFRTGPRGFWSATVRAHSNRQGQVLASNFLKPGAIVRLMTPLRHAGRVQSEGRPDTVGDPRRLQIMSVPARAALSRAA